MSHETTEVRLEHDPSIVTWYGDIAPGIAPTNRDPGGSGGTIMSDMHCFRSPRGRAFLDGPGDSQVSDGPSLVRAPTRAVFPFADPDRAVIFPIRAPLALQSPRIVVSGQEVRVCGDACRTAIETIANAGLDAWYGLGGLFHPSSTPHRYAFGMGLISIT